MTATTPEARVKAAIRAWLAQRGIWYAMPVTGGYGASGVPDFLCCWNGHFLAIEAKAPGKRSNTTVLQQRNISRITAAGGTALVVDDIRQLDELHALLSRPPLDAGAP